MEALWSQFENVMAKEAEEGEGERKEGDGGEGEEERDGDGENGAGEGDETVRVDKKGTTMEHNDPENIGRERISGLLLSTGSYVGLTKGSLVTLQWSLTTSHRNPMSRRLSSHHNGDPARLGEFICNALP